MKTRVNNFSRIYDSMLFIIPILMLFSACHPKSNNLLADDILVKISSDSSQVEFTGFNPYILEELKTDSLSNENWQHYFSVYPKVEEEMQELQKPISGIYSINKKSVSFKPDTAFEKGKTYLVELYIQDPNPSVLNQIQTKVNPTQAKIIRKELTF